MTKKQDIETYKKDVLEFTRELRRNKLLRELRLAFKSAGYRIDSILVAGYLENEDGVAVGVIVGNDGVVREFEHQDGSKTLNRFIIVQPKDVESYIPAIHVATEFFKQIIGDVK